MKYGYEGASNEQLIKNYKILDDKIVITFLNNSNYEIPFTDENECNILNTMLDQALDRAQSSALDNAEKQRKKALIRAISEIFFTLINVVNINMANSNNKKILFEVCACITGLNIIVKSIEYKFKDNKIKELKKYGIYLSIIEELEKNIDNPNLFNRVKTQQEKLNINTLDNYSLNDIKIIESNLKRIKEYSSYFNDSSNTPKLEKKIGFLIIK